MSMGNGKPMYKIIMFKRSYQIVGLMQSFHEMYHNVELKEKKMCAKSSIVSFQMMMKTKQAKLVFMFHVYIFMHLASVLRCGVIFDLILLNVFFGSAGCVHYYMFCSTALSLFCSSYYFISCDSFTVGTPYFFLQMTKKSFARWSERYTKKKIT